MLQVFESVSIKGLESLSYDPGYAHNIVANLAPTPPTPGTGTEDVSDLNLPLIGGGGDGEHGERGDGERRVVNPPTELGTAKPQEPSPFVLGEALPVVPVRLVKRIIKGEFVDMSELLKDNMEVLRRRKQESDGIPAPYEQRASRREVPDILSWVQAFSLYAAVVASQHPNKAKELWAYLAILVGEAQRCGGRGFVAYDSLFRQQMTSFEAVDFSKINQSLYSTTFLAQRGRGKFCSICTASDHSLEECALKPSRVIRVSNPAPSREEYRPQGFELPRKKRRRGACFAWNDGRCEAENCSFEHVCSRCAGPHKRWSCRSRGSDERKREDPGKPLAIR